MFIWCIFIFMLLAIVYKWKQWKRHQTNCHEDGLPFSEMPGPRSWPLVGTTPHYWRGTYSWSRLHETGLKKYKQFGDCVRETVLPGVNVVWIFNPLDIRAMYNAEGPCPSRRSHVALAHIRQSRPSLYNSAGLLPTNGREWQRIRRPLEKPLLNTLLVSKLVPSMDGVMKDVMYYVGENLQVLSSIDFLPELEKFFMESTGSVVFRQRLESLQLNLDQTSLPARLIKAAEETNSNVLATDNGLPLWLFVETEAYKKMRDSQSEIAKVARSRVEERLVQLNEGDEVEESSLLDHWLQVPDLDKKDVATALEDFLLAGVHTSAYTAAFLLYNLATNPSVQKKLALACYEIKTQGSEFITKSDIAAATYPRAVLWESLRMNPVSIGAGRIISKPTVLGGYCVPQGTVVVSMNQVSCRLDRFFNNPNEFLPERWLRESNDGDKIDPFLVLPFGHGPRACIGRRFAQDILVLFMIRFFSEFQVKWKGGNLDCVSKLINKPDSALNFEISRWANV